MRNAVTVLLFGVLVAGCGSTTGGSPVTGASGTSTPGTTQEPTTEGPTLPSRPWDIALDGLDPCRLWTPAQVAALAMPTMPTGGGARENAAGYKVCRYQTALQDQADLGYSATIVSDLDATYLLGSSDVVDVRVVDVAGFPAVEERLNAENGSPCKLAVSTTQGQHLEIIAETRPGAYTIDQACEMTTKAATFAVQTLQTLR